jgi:hypothetical protein
MILPDKDRLASQHKERLGSCVNQAMIVDTPFKLFL